MLKLDECNQLLVTNPFADDSSTVSSNNIHDTLFSPTLDSSSEHHPLRSRSVSPARRCSTPSIPSVIVIGSEVAEEEDLAPASEAPQGGDDITRHPVGPNDSFASVALRYRVSIAAIRRTNQLWPSDPIHLRTELLIPRGDTLPARCKPTRGGGTDAPLRSPVEPTPGSFPVASSFIAARNIILSLPARISLESLSSKASASEDHEMDDLQAARVHKISATETPFAEEGYELSTLAAPHAQYKRPGVPLSSQAPYLPPNNQHLDFSYIPPVGDLRSRSICSTTSVSLEQLPRTQPFSVLPVRTSQLEPEPAMELPVLHARI